MQKKRQIKNLLLLETQKAVHKPNLVVLTGIMLLFLLLFMISPQILIEKALGNQNISETWMELLILFSTGIVIVVGILYCTGIEKRSLRSMGFIKRMAMANYILGYALGVFLFLLMILLGLLTKSIVLTDGNVTGMITVFFLAYMVQGMSEEVALRGLYMMSATNRTTVAKSIVLSAAFFSMPHYLFSNGQLLFTVNTFLMGILLSVVMLTRESIFPAAGLHSAFNFFSRCLFSSHLNPDNTFFTVRSNIPGKEFLGGNSYGYTSGLIWTAAILIVGSILLIRNKRNKDHANFL